MLARVFHRLHHAIFLAALTLPACGGAPTPPNASAELGANATRAAAGAIRYSTDDAAWGRFRSKRFLLSFPLPDGKAWRIDDHSRPALFAVHEPTKSRLMLLQTYEDELVNRQKCEQRARALGWIASSTLTTVADETTIGPEGYDSRIWVALDAGRASGGLEGHVFLFGAFIRQCLLVHVSTEVASTKDEDVLSERLALARARILRGLTIEPPRVYDDGAIPRDKPSTIPRSGASPASGGSTSTRR